MRRRKPLTGLGFQHAHGDRCAGYLAVHHPSVLREWLDRAIASHGEGRSPFIDVAPLETSGFAFLHDVTRPLASSANGEALMAVADWLSHDALSHSLFRKLQVAHLSVAEPKLVPYEG